MIEPCQKFSKYIKIPNTKMNTLTQIHADIDARVQTISDNYSDWLCRMGCDGCCRRLAEIPRLTAVEWDLLQDGLAALLWRLLGVLPRWLSRLHALLFVRC
jgi:hypothetical protein